MEYFHYLCDIVDVDYEYHEMMLMLYDIPFRYSHHLDRNRVEDAEQLRFEFLRDFDERAQFDSPISVLEVLVALAKRCEDNIMHDPDYGDRTHEWFWEMITNLGLNGMKNRYFDEEIVEKNVDIFLDRKYTKTGIGAIFRVKRPKEDLALVDIYMQMRWWINEKFF